VSVTADTGDSNTEGFWAELQNDGGQSKSKTFILQMNSDYSHVRKNVSQLTYMEGISDYVTW
jgi:hypothetical protein